MKEVRDLTDLTIPDVQPTGDEHILLGVQGAVLALVIRQHDTNLFRLEWRGKARSNDLGKKGS